MQERHTNYECYFRESEESCLKYYLPYLGEYIPSLFENSPKAFEVGCVLGGNLVPFARKDCSVCGVDIDPLSINWAKNLYLQYGLKGTFTCSDIHDYEDSNSYQLIMLHDAIEHIEDKERLMLRIRELLAEDGVVYIVFPAWSMPFGGHQQVARTRFVSRCPFIHLFITTNVVRVVVATIGRTRSCHQRFS